jgi:hypothetical protein
VSLVLVCADRYASRIRFSFSSSANLLEITLTGALRGCSNPIHTLQSCVSHSGWSELAASFGCPYQQRKNPSFRAKKAERAMLDIAHLEPQLPELSVFPRQPVKPVRPAPAGNVLLRQQPVEDGAEFRASLWRLIAIIPVE